MIKAFLRNFYFKLKNKLQGGGKNSSQRNTSRKIPKLWQNTNYRRCLRTLIYITRDTYITIHNYLFAEWYARDIVLRLFANAKSCAARASNLDSHCTPYL